MAGEFTPYSTGVALFGAKPAWIKDPLDVQRLQSYDLYERMYWDVPDTYKVQMRGSDSLPIYIPSARTIIDTINRYVVPDLQVGIMDAIDDSNVTDDVAAARIALRDFFAREQFMAKFAGAKRYGIIRGDWVWHIYADAAKPLGSRVSIVALDPSLYFPVTDPSNIDKIVAVRLAQREIYEEKERVRVQLYRQNPATETTAGSVTVEEGIYEVEGWELLGVPGATEPSPVLVVRAQTTLPEPISQIPVYHMKNFEEPGNPFGSSEIRGLERIASAINQTVSDEELALALEGIGMYATDAPRPIDPNTNQPTTWKLGPGRVLHRPPNSKFERIAGISSVTPYGDHYNRLQDGMRRAAATPDVAVGTVDVQIAQSGIALALQMSPIIAKAGEKNDLTLSVADQMFFDLLTMWYAAYEETTFEGIRIECEPGTAIPVDRETRFKELELMLASKVISRQFYRSEAAKMGYEFPADMEADIQADAAAETAATDRLLLESNPNAGGDPGGGAPSPDPLE